MENNILDSKVETGTQLDKNLQCPTITRSVGTAACGALNVFCLLLPTPAMVDPVTDVVMSQTKSYMYFSYTAVRKAVEGTLRRPADW